MMKNAILSTFLLLFLPGLIYAQVIPGGTTTIESYDMPGHFIVCTTTGNRAVQLVLGGNTMPEGQWNIVTGLARSDADTVSFSPAISLENHYMRHAGYVLYCDPAGTDDLYANDASWIPRPGLANPDDPTLVSFESQNFRGRYLQHNRQRLRAIPTGSAFRFVRRCRDPRHRPRSLAA